MYKCAVNFMGDQIYVTNIDKHTLLTLAMDGKVISTFSDNDLKVPLGVHVTAGGQVLFGCYGSNNSIHVDSEGKKKLATLATKKDGVVNPKSVCYSRHTASIIVGLDESIIMVFKVQ